MFRAGSATPTHNHAAAAASPVTGSTRRSVRSPVGAAGQAGHQGAQAPTPGCRPSRLAADPFADQRAVPEWQLTYHPPKAKGSGLSSPSLASSESMRPVSASPAAATGRRVVPTLKRGKDGVSGDLGFLHHLEDMLADPTHVMLSKERAMAAPRASPISTSRSRPPSAGAVIGLSTSASGLWSSWSGGVSAATPAAAATGTAPASSSGPSRSPSVPAFGLTRTSSTSSSARRAGDDSSSRRSSGTAARAPYQPLHYIRTHFQADLPLRPVLSAGFVELHADARLGKLFSQVLRSSPAAPP